MNEQQDYQAGREGWTHYTPTYQDSYQRGVDEREGRNTPNWGGGGSNGGGGGGFVLLALLLLPLLLIGSVYVGIAFPVASLLAIIACALIEVIVLRPMAGPSDLTHLLILILPCIIFFMIGMKGERRVEEFPIYRIIRHVIRILGFGYISYELLLFFAVELNQSAPWPIQQVILVASGIAVATHFGSRWLDNRG